MAGENPWSTLRARPHLTLRWKLLPTGMDAMWRTGEILLDPRLSRTERRCALMHELVHDDRRIGWPFATAATMETEERIVRQEAAVRLVPLDQLEALARAREGLDYVTEALVADEFDVTVQVAGLALRMMNARLLDRERARAARPAA